MTEIWVNIGSSNGLLLDIHFTTISQQMPQPSITKICLKLHVSNFPGANELSVWRVGGRAREIYHPISHTVSHSFHHSLHHFLTHISSHTLPHSLRVGERYWPYLSLFLSLPHTSSLTPSFTSSLTSSLTSFNKMKKIVYPDKHFKCMVSERKSEEKISLTHSLQQERYSPCHSLYYLLILHHSITHANPHHYSFTLFYKNAKIAYPY